MTQTDAQATLALDYIRNTDTNLFLTGRAGTGKTTFLRRLKDLSPKRMIVVAPTGVAAINAGGVTIHSFFQLPFGPYIPGSATKQKDFQHKFNREKIRIIRTLDLLVIDEVSMVRADLLDAISDVLCHYRNTTRPFGGVQLLLIGDLQQLAPVAKDEEWDLLQHHYPSPYFFDSQALYKSEYHSIELTHVYRQRDDDFVELLNKIRDNRPDEATLRQLNARYIPQFTPPEEEDYITLTTHNYQANQLNQHKLAALSTEPYRFYATQEGDYPAYLYPTDEVLELKKGAQVMFIKNDSSAEKQYYNGKIGRITQINADHILVTDKEGVRIEVNRETWQNMKYTIHPENGEISEEVIGAFTQYPLKTAWAITIHKSQGLTFERAIIDAASAFSHGQVYVALSRCRTLEGMVLNSPISQRALVSDDRIDRYTTSLDERQANRHYLQEAQHEYFLKLVVELFQFETIQQRLQYVTHLLNNHAVKLYPDLCRRYSEHRDQFRTDVTEVGLRFQQQLRRMITTQPNYQEDPSIQERIQKGAEYFLQQLEAYNHSFLKAADPDIDNKEARKQIKKAVAALAEELHLKRTTLLASRDGFSTAKYLSAKAKSQLEQPTPATSKKKRSESNSRKAAKAETEEALSDDIRHPELMATLKHWRYEEASQHGLPAYTVLQQKALIGIANLLPSSERELLLIPGIGKKVADRYGETLLQMILSYRAAKGI
ncbi:AAA family ATPase [Parabacteroides sp. PFB2-10]|uniref:AAA family ATPase n=1 Tax=Parabacteroides sp. PFB2-10 TaxID=1742405 RepID=UPI002475919A|nr:AAA family ATPase [Parabacteroides sp. PFB2-10]